MEYTNQPLKLVVSTRTEFSDYGKARAELVYDADTGEVNHFRSDRYGAGVKYQGLQITAQRNIRSGGDGDLASWYAWASYGECPIKYYGDEFYGAGSSTLAVQLKTMRAIEKKWAALNDSLGDCRRFSDAVVRFGTIIGVEAFGWNDGTKSEMTGEWYRWTNASGIIHHLDAMESFS